MASSSCFEAVRRRVRSWIASLLPCGRSGECDSDEDSGDECDPPWHVRQETLLWHIVLRRSGYIGWKDAANCMLVCRQWRDCLAPDYRQLAALRLVCDSGYLTQADAFNCMQVSSAWHRCVHNAPALWRRIDLRRWYPPQGVAWSPQVHNAITAKRPMELVLSAPLFDQQQLGALLRCNAQLTALSFFHTSVRPLLALEHLRAPLHSLLIVDCEIDDALFGRIVARAPVLKQLRELLAFETELGDGTARLIAAQFTQLHTLAIVDAPSECYPVSSEAVRHLSAKGARTRATLRKLNLSVRVTLRIDDCVFKGIMDMPNLEVFNMRRAGRRKEDEGEQTEALELLYEVKYGRPIRMHILSGFKEGLWSGDQSKEYAQLAPPVYHQLTPQPSEDGHGDWDWDEDWNED